MSVRTWRALTAVAVVVQLVVLYWPRTPSVGGVPGLDLLVHLVVFGLVGFAGLRAGLPPVPLAVALLAHAVLSEAVQHLLLPGRTGDWRDAVADATGVAAGLLLARWRMMVTWTSG